VKFVEHVVCLIQYDTIISVSTSSVSSDYVTTYGRSLDIAVRAGYGVGRRGVSVVVYYCRSFIPKLSALSSAPSCTHSQSIATRLVLRVSDD